MIRVHVISTISWRSIFQLTGAEKILGLSWDKQDQILILLKDKIQVGDTLGLSWDNQDQILILLKDTIQVEDTLGLSWDNQDQILILLKDTIQV